MLPAERLRGLPVRPPAMPEPPDDTMALQPGEFLPGVYYTGGSGGPYSATPALRGAASAACRLDGPDLRAPQAWL
eukprot:14370762-Alexandrium_andersonii.AAC.1